jgi:hypothetical protein
MQVTFFLGSENLPLVKYSKVDEASIMVCIRKLICTILSTHHVHAITEVLRFLMMIEV